MAPTASPPAAFFWGCSLLCGDNDGDLDDVRLPLSISPPLASSSYSTESPSASSWPPPFGESPLSPGALPLLPPTCRFPLSPPPLPPPPSRALSSSSNSRPIFRLGPTAPAASPPSSETCTSDSSSGGAATLPGRGAATTTEMSSSSMFSDCLNRRFLLLSAMKSRRFRGLSARSLHDVNIGGGEGFLQASSLAQTWVCGEARGGGIESKQWPR